MSLLEDAKKRKPKNEVTVKRLGLLGLSVNLPLNRC